MRALHPKLRSVLGCCLWFLFSGQLGALETPAGNGSASAPPSVSVERLAQLEAALDHRSADQLLELGLAYDERHDAARAADYYRQAAAQGVGAAELRLGVLCETGVGVPQSYTEARAHYERAVSLGVPEANLRLGMIYLEGWGTAADAALAVAHIERAATAGYRPAQRILSDMYFAGVKVPRDLTLALAWAERAAVDTNPEDQVKLGAVHQAAVKLPQDLQLAREWYQLSAEQDYTRGMLAMAGTFLKPGATPADVQLGVRWLQLAADGGNSAAAFHLAGFYLLSTASPSPDNVARARTFLEHAAAAGELQANDVFEWEKVGRPLAEAYRIVITVPFEERHVHRLEIDPRFAEDAQGNRLPRPIKVVWPIYPAALRLTGAPGDALVEFTVDTTGRVRDPKVVQATHPAFAQSALDSLLATRFLPAKRAGRVVNTRVQQPVYFRMSDITTPAGAAADRAVAGSTGGEQPPAERP